MDGKSLVKTMQKQKYSDAGLLLKILHSQANPVNVAGMARFGINPNRTLGVPMPLLRRLAKDTGRNHVVAQMLWGSGIHEARILAGLIGDPVRVTEAEMEDWVAGFDSWDVCDQVCSNLFDKTRFAYSKALAWSRRKEEFVKRAGFVLMVALAVHDKEAPVGRFLKFLPLIEREANDERNFVKKAVNWALRQIGKRNGSLNKAAVAVARKLASSGARSSRWVGGDALRELTGAAVQRKFYTQGMQYRLQDIVPRETKRR
jgi:3-methyladenine DNA glycosylase AlkD